MKELPGLPYPGYPLHESLASQQMGIWRFIYQREPTSRAKGVTDHDEALEVKSTPWFLSLENKALLRLLKDVYHLCPALFLVYLFSDMFTNMQNAVQLHCYSELYNAVSYMQ